MKVGDEVKLNGGGPSMTILALDEQTAQCMWFTRDYELQKATFPLEVIALVKKEVSYTPRSGVGRL